MKGYFSRNSVNTGYLQVVIFFSISLSASTFLTSATCRSGSNAEETYNQDGRAHKNKCIANNYRRCDVTDSLCVGKNETNFVYRLND